MASRLERGSGERGGSREIAEHELRADVDDAEACALQLAIAASISAQLARVNGAIDLDGLMLGAKKSAMKSPATGGCERKSK